MYIATNSGAGFPFFPTPSPAFIVSRLSDVGVLVGVSFKFVRFRENQVRYPALYLLQKLPRRFGSTLSPHQWGGISYQTTLSFRAQLVGNNMLPSVLALESCRETQGYLWPSLAPPPFQLASTGHVLCVNFCTNLCSIFLCTWAPCPLSSPAFLSIQLAGSSLLPLRIISWGPWHPTGLPLNPRHCCVRNEECQPVVPPASKAPHQVIPFQLSPHLHGYHENELSPPFLDFVVLLLHSLLGGWDSCGMSSPSPNPDLPFFSLLPSLPLMTQLRTWPKPCA